MEKQERVYILEGLRGVAAIIVVFSHCSLGFFPHLSGIFHNFPAEQSWNGEPWFFFINGSGAVVFFFVLSGFVLSRNILINNRPDKVMRGVIKRWPRLAFLTTISTLMSWLLFHFDLYFYREAAELTNSPWLQRFAYSSKEPINSSVWDALAQGGFFTFFRGDQYFNSSLWTMHFEFIGSFIVLGMTLLLLACRNLPIRNSAFSIGIITVLAAFVSPWYPPFLFGLLTSFLLPRRLHLKLIPRLVLIVLVLYLLGCRNRVGAYEIFSPIPFQYINIIGSVLLIVTCYDIQLGCRITRMARFLGAISFPLYLLHVLVLCSLGSWVYVSLDKYHVPFLSFFASIVTLIVSGLMSLPLIVIEQRWIKTLNYKL